MFAFYVLKKLLLSGIDGEGMMIILGLGLLTLVLIFLIDRIASAKKK